LTLLLGFGAVPVESAMMGDVSTAYGCWLRKRIASLESLGERQVGRYGAGIDEAKRNHEQ